MPPRLLPDHPALIDTLSVIGGFWSFETPAIERIADPYAAMPSLHLVWAGWVACAIWSRLTRRWTKVIALTYPLVTAVVVVATANHYLLDVIGGLAVLGLASMLVSSWTRQTRGAHQRVLRGHKGTVSGEASAPADEAQRLSMVREVGRQRMSERSRERYKRS